MSLALGQMIGLSAWSPSIGVGSFLTIEFGESRINSVGTPLGQYHLWVYGAFWRLLSGSRQIVDSSESHDSMQVGVDALAGLSLRSFVFSRDEMTLNLDFGGAKLAVKPSSVPDMEEWMLFLPDGTVVVAGPGTLLSRESAGR